MNDNNKYEALLDVYKKQDDTLVEQSEQVNKLVRKYRDTIEKLTQVEAEFDKENLLHIEKKSKSNENVQRSLNSCLENNILFKAIKKSQVFMNNSLTEVGGIYNNKLGITQRVSKKLKILDGQLQLENVMLKIKEHKINKEKVNMLRIQRSEEFGIMTTGYEDRTGYMVVSAWKQYEKILPKRNVNEVFADIRKANKHLIDIQMKIK